MSPRPDRLTCEDLFRKLDDYLDRELAADEFVLVREHIELCAICAAEYRFEESLLRHVRTKLERVAVPPDLMGKISKLIDKERKAGG